MPTPPKKLTYIPPINVEQDVIGREEDLRRLRRALSGASRVLVVNGMGGIGKTTLAQAYVQRHYDDYRHIAWIEQADLAGQAFLSNKTLIERLELQFDDKQEEEEALRRILSALQSLPAPGLLVLDNATETVQRVAHLLPTPPEWHVLVTSREEIPQFRRFPLDFLSPAEARALFLRHYRRRVKEQALEDILRRLDYHTLAVELAAKTAHKQRIRLPELRDILQAQGLKVQRPAGVTAAHSRYNPIEELFPYFLAIFSLSDIPEEEAALLRHLCLLPPAFITYDDLEALLGTVYGDALPGRLEALREKGWLLADEDEEAYKMHLIVQQVAEEQLKPDVETAAPLLEQLSSLLHYDSFDPGSQLFEKIRWISYGSHLAQLFWKVEEDKLTDLFGNLGYLYENFGQYKQAAKYKEQALKLCELIYHEGHSAIATRQSNLAIVYRNLGRLEEAASLLEKALQSALANFGEKHPSVATSYNNLANIYYAKGDLPEARRLLEKALAIGRLVWGEGHPNVRYLERRIGEIGREMEHG